MKTLVVISGTSGTGKGTRVCQMIEYMRTKEKPETVRMAYKGKVKSVGLLFKTADMLFVGAQTTSNKSGLTSWTSMDYIHSSFDGADGAAEMLDHVKDMASTIVLEGEPMMVSNRWRPIYAMDKWKPETFVRMYFTYPEDKRSEYDARIVGRSGKAAGEAGWSRNQCHVNDHAKSVEEAATMPEADILVKNFTHDVDVGAVGEFLFYNVLGWPNASVEEFRKHCEEHPMLRTYRGANPLSKSKRLW